MQIEDYLYQKDLYLSLSEKTHKPREMSNGKWEILDQKTLGVIQLSLLSTVAFNVSKEKTIRDLMATIEDIRESLGVKQGIFDEEIVTT